MKKPVFFLLVFITLSSCKKTPSDFIWERTYGKGEAFFINNSPDSGFYACGNTDGSPYFIRFDRSKSKVIDLLPDIPGLFSSAWFDTSGYITGGNTGGKMLLMRYSPKGNKLWEKTINAGFYVDLTEILYTGRGSFLALASASPDSSNAGSTGLFFVKFDTSGTIINQKSFPETSFIAAGSAVLDDAGNVYLALTRKTTAAKPKASVAKYNYLLQKSWETDLYNNPDFGATSLAVSLDKAGNVYVAGKTGVPSASGVVDNSYVASLTNDGAIRWKKYLELTNTGSALLFDEINDLLTLNRNCFIIRKVSTSDGTDAGIVRTYSECVSKDTDAFGSDFDIFYDKNFLLAGSKGGMFYLALKSSL